MRSRKKVSNLKSEPMMISTDSVKESISRHLHYEIGDENIFVFGLHAGEVENLKRSGYNPYSYYQSNPELARAIDMITNGFFSPWCRDRFHGLSRGLTRR